MRFHTELPWPNEIRKFFLSKRALYARFNVFVFNLTTYCMTSLILLLVSDGSLASIYMLWTGEIRKAPRAIRRPWWCILSSRQYTGSLQNCILCCRSFAATESKFVTWRAEHLYTFRHILLSYIIWGMKDSLASKMRPNNLVSLMTLMGSPSRVSCGSACILHIWQKYMQTVLIALGKFESIQNWPLVNPIDTKLELSINYVYFSTSVK